MTSIKFHKVSDNKVDQIYLVTLYEGGDADTEHPKEFLYPFKYSEYKANIKTIEKDIENMKKVRGILDCNSKEYMENPDYNKIVQKYGEDIAAIIDDAPNDPQVDYSRKCYVDSTILRAHDEKGDVYETYDLLTK